MKRYFLAALMLAVATSFMFASCKKADDKTASADGKGKAQTICPVMGGEINKKFYADYKGNRIYFCCKECPDLFKKEPAKYLKKISESGVQLEKSPAGAIKASDEGETDDDHRGHKHDDH